jgi:hypothetical protein
MEKKEKYFINNEINYEYIWNTNLSPRGPRNKKFSAWEKKLWKLGTTLL